MSFFSFQLREQEELLLSYKGFSFRKCAIDRYNLRVFVKDRLIDCARLIQI